MRIFLFRGFTGDIDGDVNMTGSSSYSFTYILNSGLRGKNGGGRRLKLNKKKKGIFF